MTRIVEKMSLSVLLIASMAHAPDLSASTDIDCSVEDLPIQVPPDVDAIALSNQSFLSEHRSAASLLLENRASKQILHYSLVLEYQTSRGGPRLSIVFAGAAATAQTPYQPVPAEYLNSLVHPVAPGQKEWVSGQSPYTLPECASSARLTMLDIRYDDGSNYRWESSDWRTEPLLSDYPNYLSIPDSKAWTSDEYYFVARVSRQGQLGEIEPFPPTSIVPSNSVAENLKKWTFFPALRNGKPQDALLILIVRFHRASPEKQASKSLPGEQAMTRATALVELYPRNPLEQDWYFQFGTGQGYEKSGRSLREK
jgi:hypothetical protein